MSKLTLGAVKTAIITGELDADLANIRQAVKTREDMLAMALKATLSEGDEVRFVETSAVNPSYLRGLRATVTKIAQKRIVVKLLNGGVGRFGGTIRTPVELVEKV